MVTLWPSAIGARSSSTVASVGVHLIDERPESKRCTDRPDRACSDIEEVAAIGGIGMFRCGHVRFP
jgi:hypothetical protein